MSGQEIKGTESMAMGISNFSTTSFAARVEKPWGWEIHWTPPALPYVGKILHILPGARLSLQVHEAKTESWLILRGEAVAVWEDSTGGMVETRLVSNQGYTCIPGQRHRLIGITECDVLEVSTPEAGTTWRLEDDYARPDETPEQRRLEREGQSLDRWLSSTTDKRHA